MTRASTSPMTVAEMIEAVLRPPLPVRFTAYDGSSTGPDDASVTFHIARPRALQYALTAPGDLGLARAYLMGDITTEGVQPGNPYEAFDDLEKLKHCLRRPSPAQVRRLLATVGVRNLRTPEIPEAEADPMWKRTLKGLRPHSEKADSETVSSHYDRSNAYYRLVLGPSMTYTCACFDEPTDSLEDAEWNKIRLVLDKLDLQPGQRLLDIGCGWGSVLVAAARRGVQGIGVTLSAAQASYANAWLEREGVADLAEARVMDYREIPERNFDGICSLGMMEHVGVRHYDEYFAKMYSMLRPGGRLLNHQITRRDSRQGNRAGAFIDRYVFPDGELASPGVVHQHLEDSGLEVIHEENLRQHYAWTLQHWCENLQEHWDEAVEAVGPQTPLLWGLYMAGSRWNFERNNIQIHQFLAVRPTDDPEGHYYPQRPWWRP